MVKIDVISGFLGAGKTTLIKKLFEGAFKKEKIALIENEFGEIGIDGAFLKDSGIEIKEINSGCICCSLVGNFAKSLKELIDKYSPDRIIIEPSGVGKLTDVVKAIEGVESDIKINILCTVVDGGKYKMYSKNFGEFYIDQIREANTIVLSKTSNLSEQKIISACEFIKQYNPTATIITTPVSELNGATLLENLEDNVSLVDMLINELKATHQGEHHHHHEDCDCDEHEHHHDHDEDEEECHCGCGEHHHHHHADDVFTSWGVETPLSYTKQKLEDIMLELSKTEYGIILRSKGIVKASDNEKWYYFDFVAGDYEIRLGEPDVTGKLCVIGSNINTQKIEELFKGN